MGKARSIPAVLEDVKPVDSGPLEAVAPPRPITINTIRRRVARGEKFAALTCYDATTARWLERAGVPSLPVGDPAAEVVPGIARPGRLHGRVQGEEVGLEGDLVDGFDDLAGLNGGRTNHANGVFHLLHRVGAVRGSGLLVLGQAIGLSGVVGILIGHRRQPFYTPGNFFQR